MPNAVPRRFTHPEMFRKFRPELLLAWLEPARGYLAERGVVLPNGEGADRWGQQSLPLSGALGESALPGVIDYDGLVRVFMEPTPEMPVALVDGLYLVHEMGRARHLKLMLDEAQANGLDLAVGHEDTPADVALRLLLLDQRLLENLHNCQEVTRARAFQYFVTDAVPVPSFEAPSLQQLRTLEERVGEFYAAWQGGKGTRVFAYCQQRAWHEAPEWLFLVRHGVPFKREEAMENGEPTSVVFRPRRYAVLKYDTLRGEMGVYCSAPREQRVLLRLFGRHLFGRSDFFPGDKKYDLGPLLKLGRNALTFEDVPGIEEVRLTGVEFFQRNDPWQRTVQEARDIFTLIERDQVKWPASLEEITKATFTVRLWRQKRPRQITIVPSNRALYARDEESWIYEKWMAARGIIKPVPGGK